MREKIAIIKKAAEKLTKAPDPDVPMAEA